MYTGAVLGATTAVGTTVAVTMLPATGGNLLVNIAVSLAAGMLVWGLVFIHTHTIGK